MGKIVTFGEILLRLQAPAHQRLIQTNGFEAYFGGSEANAAAALAQWGKASVYVTKLPQNPIGESCIRNLNYWGVDTSKIVRGNGRLGVYYTEKGASQRPPQIVYDRKYSDFSLSELDDYNFDDIFNDAEWFHFSGITPALGGNLPALTKCAIEAAKKSKIRISCDFNYRSKLWSVEKARNVMTDLITGIDVLIINENQAKEVFGIEDSELDKIAATLIKKFNIDSVAITKRRTISGEVNEFSAMLFTDGKSYFSRTYSIFMIDKIGGGDAFSAGLIYGLTSGKSYQETIDFATASACFKHTIEGDITAASVEDIEQIALSDNSGRMVR